MGALERFHEVREDTEMGQRGGGCAEICVYSTPLPWGMPHFYFMKELLTLLHYFSLPLPPPTSSPLETASEILKGAFLTSEPACVGGS